MRASRPIKVGEFVVIIVIFCLACHNWGFLAQLAYLSCHFWGYLDLGGLLIGAKSRIWRAKKCRKAQKVTLGAQGCAREGVFSAVKERIIEDGVY